MSSCDLGVVVDVHTSPSELFISQLLAKEHKKIKKKQETAVTDFGSDIIAPREGESKNKVFIIGRRAGPSILK